MDFKKTVDQVEEAVEDLEEKAEATIKEATNTPDKDHENLPDTREGLTEKNPELEAEDTGEKIAGKVQENIGEVKKVLGK